MSEPAVTDTLVTLSRQVVALARDLHSRLDPELPEPDNCSEGQSCCLLEVAARIYGARRLRRHFFTEDLFADPAWDMLLSLYCCESEGEQVSITSLIHAAEIPQTTGYRWVQSLEKCGLITRTPHATDRRRVLVALTEEGRRRVELYLERAGEKHFSVPIAAAA